MTEVDEPSNPVLEHLRAMRSQMNSMSEDLYEIKVRVGLLESGVADLNTSVALVHQRLDRGAGRVDRIERRLDLSDDLSAG